MVTLARFDFAEAGTKISPQEARKWVHYFRTQLRVGYELEKAGSVYRESLRTALKPTHDFEQLSRYNVVDVVYDGSVEGETEVLVTGTNEDSLTLHGKLTRLHSVFS